MISDRVQIINSTQIKAGTISLRSDGIMLYEIKEDYMVDVQDLKDINQAVGKIGNGGKYPNLIMMGNYTNITNEATEYSTSDENNVYTLADAFVLKSLHQKLLANLYLKINRPKIPTRFFENTVDAVEWLKKYLSNK
jgi:hypothetical protein